MFRRVISNPSLRRVVVLSHGKRSVKVSGEVSSYSRREFSSFKDVLDKVNKEADRANKEGGNTKSKEEEEEPVKPQVARPEGAPVIGLLNRVRSLAEVFISNIKEAHQELFGEKKTSTLIRKVHQADSYRRPSKNSENEEEEEEGREASGPSDLVVVTSAKSPWEAMRDRLADSPFIREVLKSSKQYSKAVADTSIGKQASKIGQSVRDKIEVRDDKEEFALFNC